MKLDHIYIRTDPRNKRQQIYGVTSGRKKVVELGYADEVHINLKPSSQFRRTSQQIEEEIQRATGILEPKDTDDHTLKFPYQGNAS